MDPSNTSSMNGAHLQQQYNGGSSFNNFINDIEVFASGDDSVSGNDDYANFSWDPALFAGTESTSSFPQQQQQQSSMPVNLNQTLTRQSNSPALQQHHPSQSQYPHSNYAHSLYDSRNMPQPTFDDRFMSRPSASPTPFENPQTYQQMPYNSYPYQQQYPRQPSTPTSFYNQRPLQQSQPLLNIAARPSPQLPQAQQMDNNIPYHQYQNNQRMTHTFVNPSMVNSSHMVAMNGSQQQNNGQGAPQQPSQPNSQQQQQFHPSPYFQKPGTAVDPQILQMQIPNYSPHPTNTQQTLQQPNTTSQQPNPQFPNNSIYSANQQFLPPQDLSQSKPTKESGPPKKSRPKKNKPKKEGEAESDSSDGLEIEDEPEPKPALLIVTPPTDEKGRALYNAVEAVWYPRNKSPPAEDVRKGIAAFGETVRALRDAWKAKNELLKKAELDNSDTASQAPRLKEDVAHYRQTMESVMTRCFQLGHDAIVKRLGENQFTLSALYSFLLDRHYVGDYDSSLVTGIFKFAAKFETLDEEMLEQVKWTKLLQKWTKKATNESKTFAQKILSNAAIASARKKAARVDSGPGSPASLNGTKSAGVKRPRDGDGTNAPAPKKVVKPASKPLALQSAERRKALEKENKEKANGAKTEKGATGAGSTVASRPKVAMTAPPKPNAFASLLSASKKPGTSNAEKAAAAAAAAKDKGASVQAAVPSTGSVMAAKKEETKRESPPRTVNTSATKSASSFLGFLADMDKPKEAEPKKADVDPNETEEQRTKRLRKEARRKLRVTWKPDSDLVQTKIFTHDPEEETGQTDNMMRDAGDTMKEGEMLKRHMAMDDMDEDEEEETPDDLAEYSLPSEVDFSVIDAERGSNFVKLGGPGKPESSASEAQAKYEENTLMTTYTFKSDRPETPKELPSVNDDDDDFSPTLDFGEPDDKVRRREKEILARKMPQVTAAPAMDLAAQLRALGSQPTQSVPPVQAAQPPAFNPNMFGQQPGQPANVQQTATTDLSKLLAVVQQFGQQYGQLQQPQQPQQPQQAPPPQSTSNAIPANLAAIMAQLNGPQNNGLPLGNAGNPNPFPGNADFGRKHGRAEESHDQSNKKKKKGVTDGKPYNYKTVTCQFWVEGKCTKGDNCTYKHEL